jgi:hypothetical protein
MESDLHSHCGANLVQQNSLEYWQASIDWSLSSSGLGDG